jgi:hypothetical protein
MKTPADMLALDLRRMAGTIPVGWRAAILMALLVILFPLLISIFILDALTHDMPAVRTPVKNFMQRVGRWLHHDSRRARGLRHHPTPVVRHAH